MTVYVDDMRARYGRMIMCHMLADSSAELNAMASNIGVSLCWLQHPGAYNEHYDIALSKRSLAIHFGAKEITWREVGKMISARRKGIVYDGHSDKHEHQRG